MKTLKFVTSAVTYFVKNNKVVSARCNKTGRMVKNFIAQTMHDKMLNAAKNFMYFSQLNKLQMNVWKQQLSAYFKQFGYSVACVDTNGKHGLTLNTFTKELVGSVQIKFFK